VTRLVPLPYRPSIDGLRCIAVLSVFIFHLNQLWLPGGFVGVDVFFVISGYLITSIIYSDCVKGQFSFMRFYQRRIARIFPAFFTVAFATLLGAYIIYSPQDFASAGANLAASALSAANIKLLFQGSYFDISADAQPFLHYWSLSVEEQFYIFFPLLFVFLFRYARSWLVIALTSLAVVGLFCCIALTSKNPVWAFYLLPTRAWEIGIGSILAVISLHPHTYLHAWQRPWVSVLGLALLGYSLVFFHEGPHFPGWQATVPVAASLALLLNAGAANNPVEKWLSTPFLVKLGRLSFSLYLWHWPVFSLIDYHYVLESDHLRILMKVIISFLCAYLSFKFIENPMRVFLNHRKFRFAAFASAFCVVGVSTILGMSVRRNNYVNASLADVANGGLVYASSPNSPCVVLMGDSNASMYGKVVKEICQELGYRLVVISVAAGDPLPANERKNSQLWLDSLAVVEREKPDFLVLGCHWQEKLATDRSRLNQALDQLDHSADRILIMNQPPILPAHATRENLRRGVRPPFREAENTAAQRMSSNAFLLGCSSATTSVLDIAACFELSDGSIRFFEEQSRLLYHDATHLSGHGADILRLTLRRALSVVKK
jgi:peptidoglycan/LPS O-acetylase OafA/YrhL